MYPGNRNKKEILNRQMSEACEIMEHYHLMHTDDKITRFRGPTAVIYVTADPKWIKKFAELTASEFPDYSVSEQTK